MPKQTETIKATNIIIGKAVKLNRKLYLRAVKEFKKHKKVMLLQAKKMDLEPQLLKARYTIFPFIFEGVIDRARYDHKLKRFDRLELTMQDSEGQIHWMYKNSVECYDFKIVAAKLPSE
jgi:hypothetical protein